MHPALIRQHLMTYALINVHQLLDPLRKAEFPELLVIFRLGDGGAGRVMIKKHHDLIGIKDPLPAHLKK